MNPSTPPVPWSPPTWLTPDRIVLAAVVPFAAAAALPAVWWIPRARGAIEGKTGAVAVMATSTALLSVALIRYALRATTHRGAWLRCVLGGALAGVLNAGLSLAGIGVVCDGQVGGFFVGFCLGIFLGGVYGAPLGLGFGAWYAVLAGSAVRARLDPSHDGPDRVLTTAGLWLLLGGACARLAWWGAPVALSPWGLVAVGLGLTLLGAARRCARLAWLARVAAGVDPRWQVDARRSDDVRRSDEEAEGLLPLVRPGGRPQDGVLLYRAHGHDRYRSASPSEPAALTALPGLASQAEADG
ncbi:MAG TPA: hypothetical protein VL242_51550 [Sorangium sp.]|nr:hypothetical protein [Sorangium sp.]